MWIKGMARRLRSRLARPRARRADYRWMMRGDWCGMVRRPAEGSGSVGELIVLSDLVLPGPEGQLRLRFKRDEIEPETLEEAVDLLAQMPGVVPADAEEDSDGYVDITALVPDVDDHGLVWRINADLALKGGLETFLATDLPDDDYGTFAVVLTPEEAWLLVRAQRTSRAWRTRFVEPMEARERAVRQRLAARLARRR